MDPTHRSPQSPLSAPPHAPPFEALGMVLLCFGWFIIASLSSLAVWRPGVGERSFSDNSMGAVLATELVLGLAAVAVLQARGYPLRTLAPRPSWSGLLIGAGLFIGGRILISLVLPLAPHPAETPIEEMAAGAHVSLSTLIPVAIVNGTYEEVFLLGYLGRGLRRYGASTVVGIVLLVRLLYHTYQGPLGALAVGLYGLVVGVYFQWSGRLFPVVAAHIIADIAAFL